MAAARERWPEGVAARGPGKAVLVDETWAKTNVTRTHGRAPRGERPTEPVPCGRRETTTLPGAMRSSGFVAPPCVEGPVDGRIFPARVERRLCPTLSPGDVVVTGNLSSHKVKGGAEAIGAAGASVLYLPAYSPDLRSDRAGVREIQAAAAGRGGADGRDAVGAVRPRAGPVQPRGRRDCIRHCGFRYT